MVTQNSVGARLTLYEYVRRLCNEIQWTSAWDEALQPLKCVTHSIRKSTHVRFMIGTKPYLTASYTRSGWF